jgi:hypothetical protein
MWLCIRTNRSTGVSFTQSRGDISRIFVPSRVLSVSELMMCFKIRNKQSARGFMIQPQNNVDHVFDKLKRLPPERLDEVEDFIDFLNQRRQETGITETAQRVSEPLLAQVWDNPEDVAYDAVGFHS